MPAPLTDQQKKTREALRSAQLTALFFGVGMLIWGLAPAIVQRLVTGRMPELQTFAVGSVTIAVGLAFVVLGVFMGRGVRWAVRVSFITSALLAMATMALTAMQGFAVATIYPLLLSACTAGTSWLALEAIRKNTPTPAAT